MLLVSSGDAIRSGGGKHVALRSLTPVLLALAVPHVAAARATRPATTAPAPYHPGAVWQHKTPAESGLDPARLNARAPWTHFGISPRPNPL
jgi:hypothetical protein